MPADHHLRKFRHPVVKQKRCSRIYQSAVADVSRQHNNIYTIGGIAQCIHIV